MTPTIITSIRKSTATVLAVLMTVMPMGPGAFGAPALLADQPIRAKVDAKPNILFTMDDSGSMTLNYSPDYVIAGAGGYCRNSNGKGVAGCTANFTRGLQEPMFAAEFNRLYYNPNINYNPPVDGARNRATAANPDGEDPFGTPAPTIYKFMDAAVARTNNWTSVKSDPYVPALNVNTNLAAKVNTPVYCNTDWPTATYVGPATATSVWAEVGDVNGENQSPPESSLVADATKGADCRINGTAYAPSPDGAPAATDDYNYPWQSNVGTKDPQFFWRNVSSRNIWCKTNGPGWPKTSAGCPYVCSVGVLTYPSVRETCIADPVTTGGYNYSPLSCNTNPALYRMQWNGSGCVGLIPSECSLCTRSAIVTARPGHCQITTATQCGCTGIGCIFVANGNTACPLTTGTTPTGCTLGGILTQPACNPATSANCNTQYFGGAPGYTLLSDANDTGDTCRRNKSTGKYLSTRFTYPETTAVNAALYNKQVSGSCGTIPTTVPVPRYYYTVASVEFCSSQRTTNDHQWRGFGLTGTCSIAAIPVTKNDLTTYRFVNYGKFTRVPLRAGYVYPSGRTYAEEMANFANWFAYYRTRILAAKTTTSIAFDNVDDTFRTGFHTMSTSMTNWLNAADFDAAQRSAWYLMLFSLNIGVAQTPTIDAMNRIGQYVENGSGAVPGLPAHNDPFPTVTIAGVATPVTCTNNYHVLFTDGYTNQATLPTTAGERDGVPTPARTATMLPQDPLPLDLSDPRKLSSFTNAGGVAWPRPYLDFAPTTANTLSDLSLYYWMRDLRPTYENNVPASDGRGGKDLDWKKDPAWWQHVSFSAISFGSDGLLDAENRLATTNAIQAGTKDWFLPLNRPTPPNSPTTPLANPGATAVDDLWHATVNSRGTFVFAKTPVDVAYGLGSIISGIANGAKARAASSFAGQQLTAGNDFIFQATIEPGWSGELKKVTINTTTGAETGTVWSAGVKLNTLLATPAPGTSPVNEDDNTWFLNRRIVTRDPASGTVVPFRYGDMSDTQRLTLGSTVTERQKAVAYLRGGSAFGLGPNPLLIEGTAIGQFRERSGKLGNISDSKPLIVGQPFAPFEDATDSGYSTFKSTYAGRSLRVFVGGNDGMFHSFDGTSDPVTGGDEVFAYIPSSVYTMDTDEGNIFRKGLFALTNQDGGAPIFKHHFYVNSSPRWMDVDMNNCGTDSACSDDWRSLVVGGMGKGGNTYFAIDATDPAAVDESQAAGKVLWEFQVPGSEFSFSKPIIAKTRADGWVVIVASGYNNTNDGKGHLYFLNPLTGALIRTLNTTGADTGSVANPSGLAQINGFTKNANNQIIEQIYGGDLNGKVWRWDVSSADATTWQAKTILFATLTAPDGTAQPVTTGPQIEIDLNNGVDRYVFVGTGRLLHPDDLKAPNIDQVQTMYAIRDGTIDTPNAAGWAGEARLSLQSSSGTAGVAAAAPNGWYQDLAVGQLIAVDPQADLNLVAFAATAGQPDPCLTSLPAYIYGRDFVTGESLVYSGGIPQPYFYSSTGAVGLDLVALDVPGSSFPVMRIVFSKETNASIETVEVKPKSFSGGHRLSWRLLGE